MGIKLIIMETAVEMSHRRPEPLPRQKPVCEWFPIHVLRSFAVGEVSSGLAQEHGGSSAVGHFHLLQILGICIRFSLRREIIPLLRKASSK